MEGILKILRNSNLQVDKTKTAAIHCGCFCFVGASRLRVEPTVTDRENLQGMLDGYCLQRGAGVAFAFFCKRHDSPEAGGDQQASTTWAAGGLQMAETIGAGMKRKDVERSEALECNADAMSKAVCRTE